MDERKIPLKHSFEVASTWFSTHCGGGFATGAQTVSFFVVFGAATPFMSILSAGIMGVFAYFLLNFARVFKTYDYRSFYNNLFYPYDMVFATIYELLFLGLMSMGMASVFAGGGELVAQSLGLPLMVGSVIMTIIVFLLSIFGADVLRKSATLLSTVLIIILSIVTITGITSKWGSISTIVFIDKANISWGSAIRSSILYASFQCIITGTTVSISDVLETKKDVKNASIIGFLLNGVMMFFLSIMLLGYYPAVNNEVLPLLYAVTDLGMPFLQYAYNITLFLAFVTTGITLTFSIVKRFESYGEKYIPKLQTRRIVYSIIFIISCYIISLAGLLNIIRKGYTAMGYLGIPFVLIPTIIIGHKKVKRELQKKALDKD